jgi:cyclic pyranopterin phosphate synthase
MIEIYTDGAFNPVTQQGGWAAVIIEDGQKQVFSGTVPHTTNNRMEISAAMEGLKQVPEKAIVTLYTDSQYLFGCMARGWERKANRDLWEQIDKVAAARRVKWEWIDQNVINNYQKEAHNLATAQVNPNNNANKSVPELTHIDAAGKPKMVDISAKPDTEREAVAKCTVRMKPATFELIKQGKVTKGDVLTTAQLAGIMGAKQTPFLIPLCHPLLVANASVELNLDEANSTVEIKAEVKSTGKTGVEMEALTAAAVAALTVYDMCKAVDRGMVIENLRLVRKSGGKSGTIVLE